MIARVARRFVPTRDIFAVAAIDLATALVGWAALLVFSAHLPAWLNKIGDLAVHVLVLMAIWNPIQHMRRAYHAHVKRGLQIIFGGGRRLMPGGPGACPACGETSFADQITDAYGEDGLQAEGTRRFSCGAVMNSHRGVLHTCKREREAQKEAA